MKAIGLLLAKGILGLIVLGCIVISAVFAFEFGFGKGVGPVHQWAFGLAGAGLDLLKAALPIVAAAAMVQRLILKSCIAWGSYLILTFMSLWCAFGTTAGQLAERMGNKAVVAAEIKLRSETLDRLRADRAQVPTFTPATDSTVQAAQEAVTAAVDQKTAECTKRGPLCREREADERKARSDLARAEADKATTDRAADLDAKIEAAETALAAVDIKTAEKEADPQAASLSKATGWDADKITLFSHALFALGIEIGSGLGLWLLFGHGHVPAPAPAKREEEVEEPANAPVVTTVEASRARFFAECVHHSADSKVAAGVVFGAYEAWCRDNRIEAMDRHAFGRQAPWVQKKKIGGVVHYMGCALSASVAPAPVELRVVASN